MRLLVLALLLVVIVHGGLIGDKVNGLFGEGSVGERLRNITVGGFRKVFGSAGFLKLGEKLKTLRDKLKAKLALSPERKAALVEKLKLLKDIKHDHVEAAGDSIVEVNEKNHMGEMLYQSDIVLTPEQLKAIEEDVTGKRSKRQALRLPQTLWKDGVVGYSFHGSTTPKAKEVFVKAGELWSRSTCIKFQAVTHGDVIDVKSEDGCYSNVGKVGGAQNLSLGSGCETVGTAVHEIGHALGLFHTMSRYDRDQHITINFDNVKTDYMDQFTLQTPATTNNYDVPYEPGSVMHYGASSGSKNHQVTMVPSDVDYRETLGSAILSFYDISLINEHYGCKQKCDPKSSAQCKMGGYPNPNNCQQCVCPGGYGGKLCDERPNDGGETLQATSEYQKVDKFLGTGREELEFTTLTYWIESPAGTEIEIQIESLAVGLSVDGCVYGGLEIKTQKDQKMTGYRFCSFSNNGKVLRSNSNRVPVIMYNRHPSNSMAFKYRIAPGSQTTSFSNNANLVPMDKCVDEVSCGAKKLTGFCKSQPIEEQKKRCPKACGLCGDAAPGAAQKITVPAGQCQDQMSCLSLKLTGFCTKQPVEVQIQKCPRTCGHC